MSKNRMFLIIQALLCVLIAAVLSVLTVRTFIEGSAWQAAGHPSDWFYTREKAGQALLVVLPFICASAVMTMIGAVKGIKDEEAEKPVQDAELARNLICARVAEPSEEMAKERALQKKLQIAGWVGFAVCMIPILLYVTNGAHFSQTDPEGLDRSLIALVRFTAPWAIAVDCSAGKEYAARVRSRAVQSQNRERGRHRQRPGGSQGRRENLQYGTRDGKETGPHAAHPDGCRDPVYCHGNLQWQHERCPRQSNQNMYGVCRPWIKQMQMQIQM